MNKLNITSHQLTYFYDQVIEDFAKRLTIRFDGRVQGFDSEIIDQLRRVCC